MDSRHNTTAQVFSIIGIAFAKPILTPIFQFNSYKQCVRFPKRKLPLTVFRLIRYRIIKIIALLQSSFKIILIMEWGRGSEEHKLPNASIALIDTNGTR